jgi:predicted PurR-regulated permease PerM
MPEYNEPGQPETEFSPSPLDEARTNIRSHILFAIGVLFLLFLGWKLSKEILILYVSGLFAVVLMPIVRRITETPIGRYRPSRPVAIVLLIVTVLLALTIFFTIGLPPVTRDLRDFSTELPVRIPRIIARLKRIPFADHVGLDALAARAEDALSATASYLVTTLPVWVTHIFDILTAAFLCIYFMLEGEYAYSFFLSLFRLDKRRRLDQTLRRAELKISKWLIGQGTLMLILGVTSCIVFGLLHVRYFILLGILMGLFNIIPIAGGVFTILITVGVAALDSWTKVAGVLIFYIVYVNLENALITPRIMRSSVDLMGLTVLVALLLGTALAGIVGALVAVPTAALIAVFLEEYAVQRP